MLNWSCLADRSATEELGTYAVCTGAPPFMCGTGFCGITVECLALHYPDAHFRFPTASQHTSCGFEFPGSSTSTSLNSYCQQPSQR